MAAMKVMCIDKVRNNSGVIIMYVMKDETGNVFQASSEQIKHEMRSKHYEFVNLQLDKAGRLVDKVDLSIKLNNSIYKEFEKAYKELMKGNEVELGFIDKGEEIIILQAGHNVDKAIDKAIGKNDELRDTKLINDIVRVFEQYIIQKGIAPYKLHIKSKDNVIETNSYSLKSMEYSVSGDKEGKWSDLIKMFLDSKKYYYNSQNYMIRAYKLDTPNQLIENIYIAPDMSEVKINKDNIKGKQNTQSSKVILSKDTKSNNSSTSKGSTEPRSKTEETMNLINNSLRIAVNIKRLFK